MSLSTSFSAASSSGAVTLNALVPMPMTGIFSPLEGIVRRIGAAGAAAHACVLPSEESAPATPAAIPA